MATRADLDPSIRSLAALREAEARCTRCPLYKLMERLSQASAAVMSRRRSVAL